MLRVNETDNSMTRTSAPPSYLKQRSGTWYASMEIPSALRATLGKRRFMASLCTRDRKKAELLKARHLVEWQHLIDRARLGADANTPLIQRMTAIYQQELDASKAYTPRDDEPDPVAHVKEEFAYVLADNYPPEVADEVHGVATGSYVIYYPSIPGHDRYTLPAPMEPAVCQGVSSVPSGQRS